MPEPKSSFVKYLINLVLTVVSSSVSRIDASIKLYPSSTPPPGIVK